ncbi:MAG: M61 family metallopeptidase [Bryobacteraceae bacterium]
MKTFATFLIALATAALPAFSQTGRQYTVSVDLTGAPRKFIRANMTLPVQPGPLTLVYPEWIPGEHGPTGPISNVVGIRFTANGNPVRWQRDSVDMYAFHLTIPAGVSTLDARVDFLATAPPAGFTAGSSTSPNLAVLNWNEYVLYPAHTSSHKVVFQPSVTLPQGWKFGTALTETTRQGNTIHFKAVPLNMLVDSPLLAGRFFREIPLAPEITPKHYLDIAADGPEDLDASKKQIAAFSNLIRETGPLYKSRHYHSYHFLLTLSDSVSHFGLEHHQSSDDRVSAQMLIDPDLYMLDGDLLPHEFTHSWNGKYRRPAGLYTTNFQQPMKGNLLWVYEGMTQYLGDVLAARSGIWTPKEYRTMLAASAAFLDHRPGRTWRDLEDTAVAAQILYTTGSEWDNWRRSVDYYPEGELIWLDADTTIRRLSKGKRSLNDFCARFLGLNGNTGPITITYTFDDLVKALNAVQPYDWAKFFHQRLTSLSPHAPLDGITNGGYRIECTSKPNRFIKAEESRVDGVNAWYSLGFRMGRDHKVTDVLVGSPADKAGMAPGMKIVAVNGRAADDDLLHDAIADTAKKRNSVKLIVESAGYFRIITVDYTGGEKYPHLVREANKPDLLDNILKPLAKHPAAKT